MLTLNTEDVERALPTSNVETILEYLKNYRCLKCGGSIEVKTHALKRQSPFMLACMIVHCEQGHEHKLVFRADWLK